MNSTLLPIAPRSDEGSTVWILGAGFSRSLGGPLLGDLFKPDKNFDEADDLLPREEYGLLGLTRRLVILSYTKGKEERLWEDAEEFLAKVDEAWGGG